MYVLPYTGQETTANTLSFALLLVHQQQGKVLERLLAEIDEVFGNKTTVSAEDLVKLKYTEQVRLNHLQLCYLH